MEKEKPSHCSILTTMYIEFNQKKYCVITSTEQQDIQSRKRGTNGFFATWPGLAFKLFSKYLPADTEETAVGHLHQRRQGICSTKNTIEIMEPELPG